MMPSVEEEDDDEDDEEVEDAEDDEDEEEEEAEPDDSEDGSAEEACENWILVYLSRNLCFSVCSRVLWLVRGSKKNESKCGEV